MQSCKGDFFFSCRNGKKQNNIIDAFAKRREYISFQQRLSPGFSLAEDVTANCHTKRKYRDTLLLICKPVNATPSPTPQVLSERRCWKKNCLMLTVVLDMFYVILIKQFPIYCIPFYTFLYKIEFR